MCWPCFHTHRDSCTWAMCVFTPSVTLSHASTGLKVTRSAHLMISMCAVVPVLPAHTYLGSTCTITNKRYASLDIFSPHINFTPRLAIAYCFTSNNFFQMHYIVVKNLIHELIVCHLSKGC